MLDRDPGPNMSQLSQREATAAAPTYTIVGVVRSKVVFKHRPQPVQIKRDLATRRSSKRRKLELPASGEVRPPDGAEPTTAPDDAAAAAASVEDGDGDGAGGDLAPMIP